MPSPTFAVAMPRLPSSGTQPPIVSLRDQRQVSQAVFGLWLNHDPREAGKGGELALGGWNTARMQGDIHW